MSDLLAARIQMAVSLGFHIIFAVIGIGMPALMVLAERKWLKTGDPVRLDLAKRWSKGTAILFAVGAVSGTVLSFELGLLWPRFMEYAGAIIGMPFSLEGFAFLALLLGTRDGLPVMDALLSSRWALPFQAMTAALAVSTIWALVTRRYRLARVTAAGQVSALMWGWALAQAPYLVPGVHTVESAAAPAITLRLVSYGLVGGACVLVPSLWYLFRVFKSGPSSAFERMDADG